MTIESQDTNAAMTRDILTVAQLNQAVSHLLEDSFDACWVRGEISNFTNATSGHWYFTLSDKDSAISAALFKMDALRNPHIKNLKDGDKVIIAGDISVYPKRGTFQIIAKKIIPFGKGDLKEEFEKFKEASEN